MTTWADQGLNEQVAQALSAVERLRIDSSRLEEHPDYAPISGGFGTIRVSKLGDELVAVKQLHIPGAHVDRARFTMRFARELKVWAPLDHPNLLKLYGFYLCPRLLTAEFVSPFYPHGDIGSYLSNHTLDQKQRQKLAHDTALGLQYLHDLKIVHGDLKEANVLVAFDVRAILCDYGLARMIDEGDAPSGLTTSKNPMSTRFASPELMDGSPRGLPSDIWAWGCLVMKIMTDQTPYADAPTEIACVLRIARGDPPAIASSLNLSEPLRKMLSECWNNDPAFRPCIKPCIDSMRTPEYRSTPIKQPNISEHSHFGTPSPPQNQEYICAIRAQTQRAKPQYHLKAWEVDVDRKKRKRSLGTSVSDDEDSDDGDPPLSHAQHRPFRKFAQGSSKPLSLATASVMRSPDVEGAVVPPPSPQPLSPTLRARYAPVHDQGMAGGRSYYAAAANPVAERPPQTGVKLFNSKPLITATTDVMASRSPHRLPLSPRVRATSPSANKAQPPSPLSDRFQPSVEFQSTGSNTSLEGQSTQTPTYTNAQAAFGVPTSTSQASTSNYELATSQILHPFPSFDWDHHWQHALNAEQRDPQITSPERMINSTSTSQQGNMPFYGAALTPQTQPNLLMPELYYSGSNMSSTGPPTSPPTPKHLLSSQPQFSGPLSPQIRPISSHGRPMYGGRSYAAAAVPMAEPPPQSGFGLFNGKPSIIATTGSTVWRLPQTFSWSHRAGATSFASNEAQPPLPLRDRFKPSGESKLMGSNASAHPPLESQDPSLPMSPRLRSIPGGRTYMAALAAVPMAEPPPQSGFNLINLKPSHTATTDLPASRSRQTLPLSPRVRATSLSSDQAQPPSPSSDRLQPSTESQSMGSNATVYPHLESQYLSSPMSPRLRSIPGGRTYAAAAVPMAEPVPQ